MTLIISTTTTLTTSDQRQQVYERLLHRNHIRFQMGMRPIDITKMYRRKVHTMEVAEYEDLLEQYLVDAFADIAWPDSLTGRILIAVRLYKRCVDQVHIDHGVADPRDRQPDIIAVINRLVPQLR
ncbi:hypothetical protein [Thalassobius sp. Cn5-15]|uniref:hypothetical protein n=1 Tax=Thalassobius sp. Cn5-15 TaxID=2917763 RepID=UPI001EF197ED|nr:hypothetical protein [Thalassobius sp. Cn5-15]MCG7493307.1 hypothetical protein [Thalassobius sp. Cn5-15]